MPTRPTRAAVLMAAALMFAPAAARLARAADEPAKPAATETPKDAPPAEGRQRPQPGAMLERVEGALKELSLSDEQKEKVKALVAKTKEAMGDAGQGGRERLQAAGKALAALKEGLGDVLTEEQKKALAEKLPMLGRGAGEAGRPGAAGGTAQRPAVMQRAVQAALETLTDVTADQRAKLKAAVEDSQKKVREIIESTKGEREAIAEKVAPVLQAQREKFAEILSADQLTKFQAAVKEQMEKLRGEAGGAGPARPNARPARGPRPGATEEKKADEKKADDKAADEKKAGDK
jgi:Spy/CpxP family protein refolding chaperone